MSSDNPEQGFVPDNNGLDIDAYVKSRALDEIPSSAVRKWSYSENGFKVIGQLGYVNLIEGSDKVTTVQYLDPKEIIDVATPATDLGEPIL